MLGNILVLFQWKLGYGISEECIDSQRKGQPLGLKRAHYNYKRDGKGVFLVPHGRMPLSRPLLRSSRLQAPLSTSPTCPPRTQAVLRCPILDQSQSSTYAQAPGWWQFLPLASTPGGQGVTELKPMELMCYIVPFFRHSLSLSITPAFLFLG